MQKFRKITCLFLFTFLSSLPLHSIEMKSEKANDFDSSPSYYNQFQSFGINFGPGTGKTQGTQKPPQVSFDQLVR